MALRSVTLGVPQQIGSDDIALVELDVERQRRTSTPRRRVDPPAKRLGEIHEHELMQRSRLLHDDLTLDELCSALVERRGEVLVRGHALRDLHHGVHRRPSLS
jgi:hypothetical protein